MTSVHRLHLTDVTPAPHLPWARPTYPVFAYLVLHPTGPILIDTGVGIGSSFIDELYSPVHHDLDAALGRHGVAVDDIGTVITSHLHFDHSVGLTVINRDHEIASGVRVIATPGHTPGHQSALIEGDGEPTTIVCCQASWSVTSFEEATLGDDGWDQAQGAASLEKLHSLQPDRVVFSHDPTGWTRSPIR